MRKLLLNPTPLFRKLRQLSLLLTLLLAFPLSIWGEEVTKTFTFNKQVDAVTTGIDNSSMSVSITEQVTGGSSTSSDGTVNILDYYGLLSSYSCTTNSGAVFALKEIADEDKYFTIEIPGTYPSTPTQVTLTVAYNNSGANTNTENAKIVVGDYGLGAQASTQPQSGGPVEDFYNYYHPYRSNATSMTETTLIYTANNTSGLGTNRDTEKSLIIAVFLNGSASFTIKEATITYNRNPLDINWKLGGSVVTNASVTFGENYSLPQLDVSDGYIGTITYESNNSTVAIVGASGDVTPLTSGETVITATAPATNTFEGGTASYTLTVNKATPTMTFSKRQQTGGNNPGDIIYPSEAVGVNETLTTTCGSTFYAPAPTFSNGHALSDSTRFVYSYSVDGVVVFPNNGENTNNPGKINYGEISLLKAGTVTITCTFPGNLENNPCSASYKLQVDKGNANLAYNETTSNAYIDLSGNGQWGVPNGTGATAPTLTKPTNVTGITYTSSNTNVATVSSTGDVTPIGAGEATITATLSNNDSYNDDNASYQLTVKVPATISFANATASVLNTATSYTQAATTDPAGATITYESSNNNVSVDPNGQVTIDPSFYGPVTITATLTAVPDATPQLYYVLANEPAFQATYTLNVAKNFDISSIFTDASMNYATCILSEQLTKPDGLKVYYITGTNGNTVTTQEIDYLPYGIPILLEKTAATIGSVTARTDSSSVISGNILQYATSNINTTGSQYILYKNEFVKATGTIPPGKCYLQISTNLPARGVLGIGNDGSTAIEGIDVEATEDETWYDLQGRRIQKPTKAGIYIVNGKKVIINNK